MAQFFFRALPVITAKDATMDFEQLTFALNNGDVEINSKGELKLVKEAGVGPWTNPEAFSAKLEETTTVQVRKESSAASARLKGILKTKEAVPASTALFILPAGFRPPTYTLALPGSDLNTSALKVWRVKTTGVVECETELTVAHFFSFDGLTFSLT